MSLKLPLLGFLVVCVFVLRHNDLNLSRNMEHHSRRMLAAVANASNNTKASLLNGLCAGYDSNITFTSSQVDTATRYRNILLWYRNPKNNMGTIVDGMTPTPYSRNDTNRNATVQANEDTFAKAYVKTMTFTWAVLIVCLVLTLFCCIGFITLFFKCCVSCCMCFYVKGSETGKNVSAICSLILTVLLLAVAIWGLVVSGQTTYNTNRAICSFAFALDDIAQGNLAAKWYGLIPASNLMNYTLTTIDVIKNSSYAYENGTNDLPNIGKEFDDRLAASYQTYSPKTLPRPDTAVGQTYQPDYITNYGPFQSQGTILFKIRNETNFITSKSISDAQNGLTTIKALREQSQALIPNVTTVKNESDRSATSINNLLAIGNSYSSKIESTSSLPQKVLYVIYVICCLIPIYCIIWFVVSFVCKFKNFFFLNCGWFTLCILAIIGWIICMLLIPTNIALMESCDVLDKSLADPKYYNKTLDLFVAYPRSANRYLYPCLHGKVNASAFLNGSSNFAQNFSDMLDMSRKLSDVLQADAKLASKLASIEEIVQILRQMKNGTRADSALTVDDLNTLNTNANQPVAKCTPMQDTWTLSSTLCGANQGLKYQSANPDYINVGNQTCLGLDQFVGPRDGTHRYNALKYKNDCQARYDDVFANKSMLLIANFIANRVASTNLINAVEAELYALLTLYNGTFLNKFMVVVNASSNITQRLDTINTSLLHPKSGLMNNMECTIVPQDLTIFRNAMCVGLAPHLFRVSLILFLFSLLAALASLALFCLYRNLRDPLDDVDLGTKERRNIRGKKQGTEDIQMAMKVFGE